MKHYNGWPNYETWNVSMFIGNDEGLYFRACDMASKGWSYKDFADYLIEMGNTETLDGVAWDHPDLDHDRLNDMMREL